MAEQGRDIFVKKIFAMIAPYVDALSTAFSFGLSNIWRRKIVSLARIAGDDKILDICTGTGELAYLLVKHIGRQGSVTGVDFCKEMLDMAENKRNGHFQNMSFILSDAKALPFPDNTFDTATVAFGMRNIPDTSLALKEVYRVLKPGGGFLCLELTKPKRNWFLPIYKWYIFKIVPAVAKLITKTSLPYSYLPVSIETFYPPEEFKVIIKDCGFSEVRVHSMSMGIATIYETTKNG